MISRVFLLLACLVSSASAFAPALGTISHRVNRFASNERHSESILDDRDKNRYLGRSTFRATSSPVQAQQSSRGTTTQLSMAASIDLKGKVAFIAGVADSTGYGWAIAKALADAGATIIVGTWPPVLKIFQMGLKKGNFDEDSILSDGSKMVIEKIYPLDAVFDEPSDVPDEIKTNKRYQGLDHFTIAEVAEAVKADYGKIDILVHSLANGPEVTKPLLETTRKGYLAASSASAYSAVSLLQKFGPIMNEGGCMLSLTYIASEKVIPGYGGGMSSAKAQLESDTRTLAYEAGRKWNIRVNTISAGPLKSRAASAIGKEPGQKTFIEYAIDYSKANSPLPQDLYSDDVGNASLFLNSPMARTITGVTLYVDNGLHAMGMAVDSKAMEGAAK
eukprot:scaffold1588_cov222-Amphora_coffeaeformis.AAC.15